jgi:hypothetical protein
MVLKSLLMLVVSPALTCKLPLIRSERLRLDQIVQLAIVDYSRSPLLLPPFYPVIALLSATTGSVVTGVAKATNGDEAVW